jgi:hypothetical protein
MNHLLTKHFYISVLALLSLANFISCQIAWQGTTSSASWAMNCDFLGDDLKSVLAQGSACSTECMRAIGCTKFSWTNVNNGTCWLKKNPVVSSSAVYKANAMCGFLNVASTTSSSSTTTVSSTFKPNRKFLFS